MYIRQLLNSLRPPFGALPPQAEPIPSTVPSLTWDESIAATRALQQTRTIGDIYKLPFPHAIAPVQTSLALPSYREKFLGDPTLGWLDDEGKITALRLHDSQDLRAAFAPAAKITAAYNRAVGLPFHTKIHGTMNNVVKRGTWTHFDVDIAAPRDEVQLAAPEKGTLVVPHDATYRILEVSHRAGILKLKADDRGIERKLERFYRSITEPKSARDRVLSQRLQDAMVEMPADSVNLITGVTIHAQPPGMSRDRTCYQAITHFTR